MCDLNLQLLRYVLNRGCILPADMTFIAITQDNGHMAPNLTRIFCDFFMIKSDQKI